MDAQFVEWVEGKPYSERWLPIASLEISLGTNGDMICSSLSRVPGGA